MKKILVTITMDEKEKNKFMEGANAEFIFVNKKDVTSETLKGVNGIIGNADAELINQCPTVDWFHLESAGADKYAKVIREDIQLTNSTGAYGQAIAEHLMGGVFYFYKKIDKYAKAQVEHQWESLGPVDSVAEATVCIIGYGDIGQNFGRMMKALGSRIIGVKRTASPAPYADKLVTLDQLEEVLPEADIIALALPSTPETQHLFNERLMRLCKKSAVLLNVGRGVTIHTDGLMNVLDEGWFKGVSLDVTDPEPLPVNHPLWRYDNVLITPHVSGFYNMRATYDSVLRIAKENLMHYLNNEELINQVDRKTGYRKSQ